MAASPEPKAFALGAAIEKLKHAHESVRLSALGEILGARAGAQALDQIAACLNDSNQRVRRAAITVLGETGPVAIAALTGGLNEKQPCAIRMLAASLMARWSDEASSAIDPLIACLRASEEELRSVAALALGKIGGEAVPALRKLLSNSNSPAQVGAAQALGYVGHSAAEALDDLRLITKGQYPVLLQLACASAAFKISGNSQDGLPIMLKALQSSDEPTRLNVLQSLGESGPGAQEATQMVVKCLDDKSATIRSSAALAMGRIGARSPEVITALIPLLADSDSAVRLNTVVALSALAAQASEAFAALQQAQKDKDSRVAVAATAAVERINGRGKREKPS